MSGTILDRLVGRARQRVAGLRDAASVEPGGRAVPGRLREALAAPGGVRIIAEIKRASPSRGVFAPDLDAAATAAAYRRGGASAVSVLTEPEFFHGSADDLRAAARASGLPVLRKDFLIDALQLDESAAMGASAVLLIAAILPGGSLPAMIEAAGARGLDALVEVHDAGELERALQAGASIIGVNRRDLRTFRVDAGRAESLAARIPDDRVRVAESGVRDAADVRRMGQAGYHAVLVGEHLARAADPEAAVRALAGA